MPEPHRTTETGLQRVLLTLRPYLPDVILIGGWVPYLYRRYGSFSDWNSELSFTSELDVLLSSQRLQPSARPTLPELLREAGLQPVNEGEASAVWRGDAASDEEIEFLVPLTGVLHSGITTTPVADQPGLAAVVLPYLDILKHHSGSLRIPITVADPPHPGIDAVDVRVPGLGAYVLNKALTFSLRQPRVGETTNPKRAKDLLYLRDLSAAGDAVVTAIDADLTRLVLAEPVLQHAVDTAASHIEAIVRRVVDLGEVARMLHEREPGRSLAAAEQDVQGHLTDLFEVFETHRTPPPPQQGDDW